MSIGLASSVGRRQIRPAGLMDVAKLKSPSPTMMRYPHLLISAARRVWPRRRPDGFTLLLAGLGVLGAALVLARAINYGVGLEADAVAYISVARSLWAGNGFTTYAGNIYHAFPPLYPLLLATASLGIFDPWAVAGPLNAGLFGLTVFVVGMYLRTQLQSRLLTLWCCLAAALAWPLLDAAHFAWSELPFILFSTLALMQSQRALSREGSNAALLWAGAFTALACLSRYVGVTLVALIVPLLAFQRGVALPAKARRIVSYGLVALAPLALWMLRNQLAVGNLTGSREYPRDAIQDVLYAILTLTARWLPELQIEYLAFPTAYVLLGLWVALLAPVSGGAVRAYLKGAANSAQIALLLFAGLAAAYLATLIGATVQSFNHGIGPRYLVPAYLPALVATALALDPALRHTLRRAWARAATPRAALLRAASAGAGVILIAFLLLWLADLVSVNIRAIYQSNNRSLSLLEYYNYASLADSAALRYIREEIANGAVFSDHILAVYIHTNELTQPRRLPCNADAIRSELSATATATAGAAYLLWLYSLGSRCEIQPDYYGGLDGLLAAVPLELTAAFDDGVLLRYRPPAAPAAADAHTHTDADAHTHTDAAARRDLRRYYAAIAEGVPAAVSAAGFNLYLDDTAAPRWAIYINDQCAPDATQIPIYLRIVPVNRIYLTKGERPHGVSAYSLEFDRDGIRIGSQCMVSARLPNYAISTISTGQYSPDGGVIWEVEYEPGKAERLRAELAAARQSQPPVIQSDFAVYRNAGRLIYAKAPCTAADTQAAFFLHIVPANHADLPESGRPHGFDNRDFAFDAAGSRLDGRQCIASVALPDYDIAVIRTGQYSPDAGDLWTVEYPDRVERLRAEYAAVANRRPVIQADFAVYHSGNRLIYAKAPCTAADTQAAFFLHIVPANPADLPESGRPHGFDNRDFAFDAAGALLDGQQCVASTALPEYDIAAIRTGQYVPGAGRLWAAEFAPAGR